MIRGADTVLTFDPHPSMVVAPGGAPKLLTTLERKAELIAALGVEELVVIPFDREFAARQAQAFVDDVLVGALQATHVSVGENFRFGHKAQGDCELLAGDGRFETRVVPLLEIDGEVVSSSHIRGLVLGGALEYAGRLLGDPFSVVGRGRPRRRARAHARLPDGQPAARARATSSPGHGVYACRAHTADGAVHAAATNVGVRPMFVTGRGELIEAFLIDFDGDLYEQELRVEFLRRLRGERRFDSVDALVEQMGRDVDEAREIAA